MAFRPDLSAPAACSIASPDAIAGIGLGKAGAGRSASSHAVSAGRIKVAICPGYWSAACTARAASEATVRALADECTQPETVRANPGTSEASGASYCA
jgi:hypothetical protein